jgi:hypothetical protein
MTAQSHESITYNGQRYSMATEPLNQYLRSNNVSLPRNGICSSCWRGYTGFWEIKNDRLYLTGLEIFEETINNSGMNYLFPGQREVFAEWFSGEIRIVCGKMLHYVHLGYESVFEEDMFLYFKDGVLINERIVDNRDKANILKSIVKQVFQKNRTFAVGNKQKIAEDDDKNNT